jgi:hypothetical protein
MKVTFTAKEYTRLLELVHLGMHVITAHQGDHTPTANRYAELEQKLYELATPLGCADLVELDPDGRLSPSEKILTDDRLSKILGDHTNDVFWHEFVGRLTERDCAGDQAKHALTATGGPSLDTEARMAKIEDAYWDEFEKNDLANIVLLRGGRG